jgi:hypothetical protein
LYVAGRIYAQIEWLAMQYKILNLFVVTTVCCFVAAFLGCRTLADLAFWLVVTLLTWELVQFRRDLATPIQDSANKNRAEN